LKICKDRAVEKHIELLLLLHCKPRNRQKESVDSFAGHPVCYNCNLCPQVAAFPQGEAEPEPESQPESEPSGFGGLLGKAGKVLGENKGAALDLLGLGDGQEALTKVFETLKFDPATVTNLTSAFTGQEGIASLMDAFKNPEKLSGLLAEKTGMDPETIKGVVDTVKNKFK